MQTIHLATIINAPRKTVWHVMLDDATYREWTKAFNMSSYYEGAWEEGTQIRFLGTDEHGEKGGIASIVKEVRPYEFVSLEHQQEIKNGVEITEKPKADSWKGALENYTFIERDGGRSTELVVDTDMIDEYRDFMEEEWKKALASLKEIAEREAKRGQ